jgi:F-type H+-transporting ATPase subunit gamma
MPGIKELKTRIKSIGGTRKVTRAMQMVSAAKMRKSQDATMRSRSYASLAWELIISLSGVIPAQAGISNQDQDSGSEAGMTQDIARLLHSFPKASKIAVLILTTNRGMVGSLNANLVNLVQKTINELTLSTNHLALSTDFITYGRKGRDVMVKSHKEVLADFEKYDRVITTQDIAPIANFITNIYSSGKYQKVLIFYNHFVSTLMQKPTVKQLLPFTPSDVIARSASDEAISSENKKIASDALAMTSKQTDYLFEPDPKEVLEHLLPRIIESQIYQTILESEASEQSARMVMMKNATEAAGDLISDLTLTYNKLRQNKITTELAEITAGKIALE